MSKQDEIQELKSYLITDYYNTLKKEQRTDDDYYNDKFDVPQLKLPATPSRTGRARRMIDRPAAHIITSNPQVFKEGKEPEARVAKMLNNWISVFKRQNPNPFKESVRNLLLRGESWVHIAHNESWVTGKKEKIGLPVFLTLPDPLVIYADPTEDVYGVPKRVMVWYERIPWIVRQKYPNSWTDPLAFKRKSELKTTVQWLGYWDEEYRYFEADGEPVLEGKNIYGFVPWVHCLSGFGKNSPSGEPTELIVGLLRYARDTLVRECAQASSIDRIIYLLGQPQKDFRITVNGIEASEDLIKSYTIGLGVGNVIPYGVDIVEAKTSQPTPEMFQHLYQTRAELDAIVPAVLSGMPGGTTSGYHYDAASVSAMRMYDTIVENVENQFATALGMGLKMIDTIPGFPMPDGLNKNDINGKYDCILKLKAADPIEDDRKATLGSRLFQQGEIDWKTNLIKYQGYTEDEANRIIAHKMADLVTIQSPDVAELIGVMAARELGMEDELQALKMRRQMIGQQQSAVQQAPVEGTPREGNIQSDNLSRQIIERSLRQRGARTPPERTI